MFEQGAIQQTGNPLDIAIQGNGLFVVNGKPRRRRRPVLHARRPVPARQPGFVVNQQGLRAAGLRDRSRDGSRAHASATCSSARARARRSRRRPRDDDAAQLDDPAIDPAIRVRSREPDTTSNYATSASGVRLARQGAPRRHVLPHRTRPARGSTTRWSTAATRRWHRRHADRDRLGHDDVQHERRAHGADRDLGTANFVGATPAKSIAFTFGNSTQTANDSSTHLDGNIDRRRRPRAGKLTDIVISDDGTIRGVFDNGDTDRARAGRARRLRERRGPAARRRRPDDRDHGVGPGRSSTSRAPVRAARSRRARSRSRTSTSATSWSR